MAKKNSLPHVEERVSGRCSILMEGCIYKTRPGEEIISTEGGGKVELHKYVLIPREDVPDKLLNKLFPIV
jgi:hypothetical protein